MDNVGTTQTNSTDEEQGQVSAQAEPKDNKQTHYSENESEETEMPSTGEPFLDKWIAEMTYGEACIAYACMEMSWVNNALGDKLEDALKFQIDEMLSKFSKSQLDVECEVLPGLKWLSFYKGMKANEEPVYFDKAQQPNETTDEPQAEEANAKDEKPKDEKPQLLDDPHPMTTIKNWLSKRTYSEKMTAVLISELLSKDDDYERYGCCEKHYGNIVLKDFQQAIIEASQDKEYFSKAEPEEIVMTGLVTSLLFWYG